ncbi:MAG: hypothetical protein QXQ68_05900 [Candidatus Nitrosocaldaceae archaeon]
MTVVNQEVEVAVKIAALVKRAAMEEQKARGIRKDAYSQVAGKRELLRAALSQKRAALNKLASAPVEAAKEYLAASAEEQRLRREIELQVGSSLLEARELQRRSNSLIKAAKLWSLASTITEANDQSVEDALAMLATLRA